MSSNKIIVSNFGQLSKKYGGGLAAIRKAVQSLVKADKARGIVTKVIALDDAAQMKKLKAPVVKKAGSARENKRAIDGVYKALQPDYLMILGAIDVVPHQPMTNPKPKAAPIMPKPAARFSGGVTSATYALAAEKLAPVNPLITRVMNRNPTLGASAIIR